VRLLCAGRAVELIAPKPGAEARPDGAGIDAFGVERCMSASNFPVDKLFSTYDAFTAGYAPGERLALFHDNAARYCTL